MEIVAEDAEDTENAEEQRFGWHTRNEPRLTEWVKATQRTADNRRASSSASSA